MVAYFANWKSPALVTQLFHLEFQKPTENKKWAFLFKAVWTSYNDNNDDDDSDDNGDNNYNDDNNDDNDDDGDDDDDDDDDNDLLFIAISLFSRVLLLQLTSVSGHKIWLPRNFEANKNLEHEKPRK